MEIERKFLIKKLPDNLNTYPFHLLEISMVVRVRRSDDTYTLTFKSKGLMSREEYNLPLTAESYEHLKKKADGNVIRKKRYCIPFSDALTIELDLFDAPFEGLVLAEVEFSSEEQAMAFLPPEWFGEEVTWSAEYHNSTLSRRTI